MNKVVSNLRRVGILAKKRASLFKYNLHHRVTRGDAFDFSADTRMLTEQGRSLNLLDFSQNGARELFLCDIYSDQVLYGGLSETELEIMTEENHSFCKFHAGKLTFSEVEIKLPNGSQWAGASRLHVLWIQLHKFTPEKL